MPQIRVKTGYQQGAVYPLTADKLIIGRDPECDIPLDIESPASRHHASIYNVGGRWRIRDLDSLNGTLLNDQKLDDSALQPGDKIVIGTSIFVFEDGGVAPG